MGRRKIKTSTSGLSLCVRSSVPRLLSTLHLFPPRARSRSSGPLQHCAITVITLCERPPACDPCRIEGRQIGIAAGVIATPLSGAQGKVASRDSLCRQHWASQFTARVDGKDAAAVWSGASRSYSDGPECPFLMKHGVWWVTRPPPLCSPHTDCVVTSRVPVGGM